MTHLTGLYAIYGFGVAVGVTTVNVIGAVDVSASVGVSVSVIDNGSVAVNACVDVNVGVASNGGSAVACAGGSAPSGVGVGCARKVSVLALTKSSTLNAATRTYHGESDAITA